MRPVENIANSLAGLSEGELNESQIELRRQLIDYLGRFMLPERFDSLSRRLEHRTRYMLLCLEDIYYPHNASATIRSAEAFGLQEIHAVESHTHFRPSKHIVRGTDQWIDLHRWDDTPTLVSHLRERGYRIVVTSPREGGATPADFDVTASPFALFMGTEKSGASQWLMEQADEHLQIPMVGFAESLNISVSAAIILQRLTERLREPAQPTEWQLKESDREELLFRWLRHSVRDSERILLRYKTSTDQT